jgi:hypothetical protein
VKACTKCGTEKPLTDFRQLKGRQRHSWCRACEGIAYRARMPAPDPWYRSPMATEAERESARRRGLLKEK